VIRYHDAVRDEQFDREVGVELLVETARLWASLGHVDSNGDFRIDGGTGPDAFSSIADNNTYTNLMAQRNLLAAAAASERQPDVAASLGVTEEERTHWRQCAEAVILPYDTMRGVHMQAESFTHHEVWDFENTPRSSYPRLLHYPYFELYRMQVCKQADLVLAMHLCGDAFTPEQKAANFRYYEAITVRDSSLSAATQAVVAAEVGHLDLALDYAAEAAFVDLHDLAGNTRDGLHMASLAGVWMAMVGGFGGMRDHGELLQFAPRLPKALNRLAFTMRHLGLRLRVETDGVTATYRVEDHGSSLDILHHGKGVTLQSGKPVTLPIPPIDPGEPPKQPAGRAPRKWPPPSRKKK
jgi:alpha,alpha-trehalose phosphorylase